MKEKAKDSAQNFIDDLIERVQERFRVMEKYSNEEGICQIPMKVLEKSPRYADFICHFSIGTVTRKWAALKKNKKSCEEFLETRGELFSDKAAEMDPKERDVLWKKFLCLRNKVLEEIPTEWKRKQAFAFFEKCVEHRAISAYFKEFAAKEPVLYKKYRQKKASGDKSYNRWLSNVYKMKVPQNLKDKTKHHILNKLFLHYRQARTKLSLEDKSLGFTSPFDGYCLRAITEILYDMAKENKIAANLPKNSILPESFVKGLCKNRRTKDHIYRCDEKTSFDDLVVGGLKKGALVFMIDDDGDVSHAMFWDGAKSKSGEAELLGFNNEESGVKISKDSSGENRNLWVFDVYGFAEQEFLFLQKQQQKIAENFARFYAEKNAR